MMAVRDRPRTALKRLGRVLIMFGRAPAKLAHELTHLLFLSPWLEEWAIQIDHEVTSAIVNLDEDIPRWAFVLGHLAPFVVGSVLAVGALAWALVAGIPAPETASDWAWLAIALLVWATYSWPSAEDRNPERLDKEGSADGS
jgi:hypothetical protein